MRYDKKLIAPLMAVMMLAAGCGAKDNNVKNAEEAKAGEAYNSETQEFDYKCYEVADLQQFYEAVEESDGRTYICDYDEYKDICEAMGEDCTYDNENMKYAVVANEGKFIKAAEPVRFITDSTGETSLYVHEELEFVKDGLEYGGDAYVMVFPVSSELDDLSVYFCTSQDEIQNKIDAINEENNLMIED